MLTTALLVGTFCGSAATFVVAAADYRLTVRSVLDDMAGAEPERLLWIDAGFSALACGVSVGAICLAMLL